MRRVSNRSFHARRARDLLQAAHDACFREAKGEDILAMTHGPFSGVNEVLGCIANLDADIATRDTRIRMLERQLRRSKPAPRKIRRRAG